MSTSLDLFLESLMVAISRVPYTMLLAIATFVISGFLGFFIAVVRHFKVKVFSQLFAVLITIYLGVPIMVAVMIYRLIFLIYYNDVATALSLPWSINDVDIVYVALFALVLTLTCTMTETFRGGLSAIDKTQYDACAALGMKTSTSMVRVIWPQLIPIVLPQLITTFVGCIQATSLVSVVGVIEILNGALQPAAKTYGYWEGYLAAALVYWALTIIVEQIGKLIEKRSTRYRRQMND